MKIRYVISALILLTACGDLATREEKKETKIYEGDSEKTCICIPSHCNKCPTGMPIKVVMGDDGQEKEYPAPIIIRDGQNQNPQPQLPVQTTIDGLTYTCYPRPSTCTTSIGSPCPFLGRLSIYDRFREIPNGNGGWMQCVRKSRW